MAKIPVLLWLLDLYVKILFIDFGFLTYILSLKYFR